MTLPLDKLIKGVVGAIVLLILFLVLSNWWSDFKTAASASKAAETETTATTTPAAAPEGEGGSSTETSTSDGAQEEGSPAPETSAESSKGTVVVMIEGLNFRERADRGSKALRALSKGEKVELLDTIDSWYQVRDKNGDVGWISSNPAYSKVEK